MVSRVFVRTVLVAIMAGMVYLMNLTWASYFNEIAQKVPLMIIESGVLLAALSLFIESLRSFGTITISEGGLWAVLSGSVFFSDFLEEDINSARARTCALFWVRSFMLSFFLLLSTACLAILYQGIINLDLFLSNPYVPNIMWKEIARFGGIILSVVIVAFLLFKAGEVLRKKMTKVGVRSRVGDAILCLYGCAAVGTFIAVAGYYLDKGTGITNPPFYMMVLEGTGIVIIIFSVSGMIMGIGYGLYKLVGTAVMRFPVLGNVWNTLCPVQTIKIAK